MVENNKQHTNSGCQHLFDRVTLAFCNKRYLSSDTAGKNNITKQINPMPDSALFIEVGFATLSVLFSKGYMGTGYLQR